ncbi:MAG: cation transporter [Planctomycetota bacterium]|nr:cation transporter [Planctomycetota bacterium]
MADGLQERTLAVKGMHCASCAQRVETALRGVAGVDEAAVNFATRSAHVAGGAGFEELARAVKAAGYELAPMQADGGAGEERAALGSARLSFLLSAVLTVPVMLTMVPGLAEAAPWLAGWGAAILTTLVLAGPGRGFFVRAARQALRLHSNMDTLVALGAGAAWLFSAMTLLEHGAGHAYFESAAVIVTLVLLGRWFEERARFAAGTRCAG